MPCSTVGVDPARFIPFRRPPQLNFPVIQTAKCQPDPMELTNPLPLKRCPHCGVSRPNLTQRQSFHTESKVDGGNRIWRIFACERCGGVVTAAAPKGQTEVTEMYPEPEKVDDKIPSPADTYLSQALESMHAPAGAIMLAASSVDAMLKAKEYKNGSLYKRIDQAAEDHVITSGMAEWAHEVRLDANAQRHADEDEPLPSEREARRVVDFVVALGEFLFTLPARVDQGIEDAKS